MVKFIGIAGGSGSGKTTFAEKLIHSISEPITLLTMDNYYLPKQPKHNLTPSGKANFDHPQAFDWELLRLHIDQLKRGLNIHSPLYDFKVSSRTNQTKLTQATSVIIFEGIFTLFDQAIREMLDIKVFLHVDSDIRFTRRLNRDFKERKRSLESIINQYYETVRPMHSKYLEPQKQYADFVVGEETDIAADILAAKITQILNATVDSRSHPQIG